MFKTFATVLGLSLVLASCAKSPTGRHQLKLYSGQQMQTMGMQSFDQMKQDQTISQHRGVNSYVNCVAKQVVKALPGQQQQGWEVVVFDSDQVNAFALPGRKIGVYTGLLRVAENQDQLAAVIGHEIGHVIADHGNERVSNKQAVKMAMTVADGALRNSEYSEYQQMAMGALGLGMQVGVLLPYSRTHESEADYIGLELLAKANFKPQAAVTLWHNMAKNSGGKSPSELMSTHPSPATRINKLAAQINNLTIKPVLNRANCQKPSFIPKAKKVS